MSNLYRPSPRRVMLTFKGILAAVVLASTPAFAGFGVPAGFGRPAGFDFSGLSNRVMTPNGDGFNDSVSFRFSNPRDSSGVIRLYDSRGRHLRDIAIAVGDTFESWDGRAGGQVVNSGVYIYVMTIENKTYSGSVLVIR